MALQFDALAADYVAAHAAVAAVEAGRRRHPPPTPPAFIPGAAVSGARQTFARLGNWLAQFGPDALFTVTLSRPRRCPIQRRTVCRDEHHHQVPAAGVRSLAERHGARVRRIEPEPIGAAAWSAAIERWGNCE